MTMQLCFTRGIIVTFRFKFIHNTSFRVFYWLRDLGSIWLLYFIQQHLVCAITEDAQVSRHRGPCLSIHGFVQGKYKCVFINSLITPKKIQHNFIITFHCGPGWLNELGRWITLHLIQAYHQYGVGSRPAL
jgi:hypothetical protein